MRYARASAWLKPDEPGGGAALDERGHGVITAGKKNIFNSIARKKSLKNEA